MNMRHAAESTIPLGTGVELKGFLERPENARGLIVFVHGRFSFPLALLAGLLHAAVVFRSRSRSRPYRWVRRERQRMAARESHRAAR